MKTEDIISHLEKLAPLSIQEHWDNSGIQIKSHNKEVNKILLTLDILEDTVDFALEKNCNLIISHHPLFFKSIKNISIDTSEGRLIYKIIKNEINVVSFHTNIDSAKNGLADYFVNQFNLTNVLPLVQKEIKQFKIITFIPENYLKSFTSILLENNLSIVGNYKACSFYCKGKGTFFPSHNATPFCGDPEKLNTIDEIKIEIVSDELDLSRTLNIIKNFHPYEEPLIDIFELNNHTQKNIGFGRVGLLRDPLDFSDFIKKLKEIFNTELIKITGNNLKEVKKIAICPGSGGSLIKNAIKHEVDIFITGDVKYHEALEAEQNGIAIIDIGHFETEIFFVTILEDYIKNNIKIPTIIYNQKNLYKYI